MDAPPTDRSVMVVALGFDVLDPGAHGIQLGEEGQVERAAQERHAGGAAGAPLGADDPLDGLQVAEPPELEVVLHVHELLAHLVDTPVLLRRRIDAAEHVDEVLVELVRLRPVAVQHLGRHVVTLPSQPPQHLVVQTRLVQQLRQLGVHRRVVLEHTQHLGVLVAEQELDGTVLPGLEAGAGRQEGPELGVLAGGQRGQDRPLLGEHDLDVLHAGDPLERRLGLVGPDQLPRRAQLVQHQLEPQLGGLVLDDEEHLVVPHRHRPRVLRGQHPSQVEVLPVGQVAGKVPLDPLLQGTLAALPGLGLLLLVGHANLLVSVALSHRIAGAAACGRPASLHTRAVSSDQLSGPATDADVPTWVSDLGLPGLADIHVHFLPERMLQRVWGYFDAHGWSEGGDWPIHYRLSEAERLARVRALGLRAVPALTYAHKPGMAAWLNEWCEDFAQRVPDAVPSGTFFPEPEAAAYVPEALDRGVRLFKTHVTVGGFDPTDPLLDPAWSAVQDAGVPVVLHAGSGPHPGRHTGPEPV